MYNNKKYYYDLVRWYFDEEVSLEKLNTILKCPNQDLTDQYQELKADIKKLILECYKNDCHIQKAALEVKNYLTVSGVI